MMRHAELIENPAFSTIPGFTLDGAQPVYPPDLHLEPVHLRLEAMVDLAAQQMVAQACWTVVARNTGTEPLVLQAMNLEDVQVHGASVGSFAYDGRRLTITLAGGQVRDERYDVTVSYRVTHPEAGLYFSAPTAAYPHQGTFVATDNETERARYWLPCVDAPASRTTLELRLRVPSALTVIANGALTDTVLHDDGTSTSVWTLEQPCPSYLICFAVGDFLQVDDGEVDGVPIRYFTTREFAAEDLHRTFAPTGSMLRWLQQRLGVKYPYPKYYQFAAQGIGGAMENISLVSWDDRFVLDAQTSEEWQHLIDQINVHEMAHMWFGDLVVCRDYTHSWLKESWATYIEQVWYRETRSIDDGDYENFLALSAYRDEADGAYVRPLVMRAFQSSWQMYDRHLYPGGAVRLEMLRGWIGDDAFWRATTRYLKTFSNRVVETDDFRRIVEEESGRSLGRFFDQWIHSPGYPKLKVGFVWDATAQTGTWTIEQTQVDEKRGIGLFEIPTDVGWVIGGQLHTENVLITGARFTHTVRMNERPEQVRVNAIRRAVIALDMPIADDWLRTQLTDAADVQGRILAGRQLCQRPTAENLRRVADAALGEVYWGVRVQHVSSLAGVTHAAAVEGIRRILAVESDARALPEMLRACGRVRNAVLASDVTRMLESGLRPRAAAAALELLGQQTEDAPLRTLMTEASTVVPVALGPWRSMGAVNALAHTRKKKAANHLLELVREGALASRVRPVAVRALARLLPWMERETRREHMREVLMGLLTDADARVRMQAALGLCDASVLEARPALESFAGRLSNQDQVTLRKAMLQLKPGSPVELAKELDALRERVVALEKKVETAAVTPVVPPRDEQDEEGASGS